MLKKPIKRKKKSALQRKKDNDNSTYWRVKADKEWARLIHSSGRCLIGHECAGNLEAHHLISRSVTTTRHNPLNGVLLCSKHHKFDRKCSPHMGPLGFAEFLRNTHIDKYEFAAQNRYKTGKPNYKESYYKLIQMLE